MTQEQKRIKIAEACGFDCKGSPCGNYWYNPNHSLCNDGHVLHEIEDLPDYFNDLNACQQAWETLDGMQHAQFKYHLARIVRSQMGTLPRPSVSCATAAQRAEAFGLTLNLWTNS